MKIFRSVLVIVLGGTLFFGVSGVLADTSDGLIESISKRTLRSNRQGGGITWFHPRACRISGRGDGDSSLLMTLQEIGGSDYFGPVHWSESRESAEQWSEPQLILAFDRQPVPGDPGLKAGVCDVVPQFHPQTGTVLALGHVVFYRGAKFSATQQRARYPVYSVRGRDGVWSERRRLEWDDPRGGFIYTNNCGQRLVLDDGDVLLALSFGAQSEFRSVAVVRCAFDGETLQIRKMGTVLDLRAGRGLLEPSLARFGGRYHMTLRAEDGYGYQSVSDDGLDWLEQDIWRWDDGEAVNMSSTQQHWMTHSEGLFLVYTRRDARNENVIRWRSPLWITQVNPETRRLMRATEQVVLPLVGDGVESPDEVALMGNFHVTAVSPWESWVTVGEWLPRGEARGDLLCGKIRWKQPNRLFDLP